MPALRHPSVVLLVLLTLAATRAFAEPERIWQAGVEEDPFASGHAPNDGFAAARVNASAGPNTIQIFRQGPGPANLSRWTQFDFAQREADVGGLAAGDGDGLPRWWETDNFLSDGNVGDALIGAGYDGLGSEGVMKGS